MRSEAAVDAGSGGSARSVSEDYMIAPAGGELTGAMRFVMSQPVFDEEPLRFSDLALFTIGGRYSVLSKLEVSASTSFLAKQPSDINEKPWQNATIGLRSPLNKRTALAVGGAGGHLLGRQRGWWTSESIAVQWKKPIEKLVQFDLSGGLDGVSIAVPHQPNAFITEISMSGSTLFREPSGHWGAWLGLGYAIPIQSHGHDAMTGVAYDPQPRLDFHAGTVLSLNRWDLFVDFAVVDRGDLANPATRLPIVDGGFDQRQILFGVTRHIDPPAKKSHRDYDPMELSER